MEKMEDILVKTDIIADLQPGFFEIIPVFPQVLAILPDQRNENVQIGIHAVGLWRLYIEGIRYSIQVLIFQGSAVLTCNMINHPQISNCELSKAIKKEVAAGHLLFYCFIFSRRFAF
jgi:hypothetical protein